MIKPGALVIAVLMGAVSAGTYYGLDLLPAGALPEPIGRAHKPEPPKPGAATLSPGATTTETATAPAPAEPAPAAEQPVTEQDLAEDPAPVPAEPAPAPAPTAQAQAAAAPEPEPEPAAAPAPTPKPAPKPQKPAPALVDEPAPAQQQKPKVQIVDGRNEASIAEAPTAVASAEPARSSKAAPPESDVIKPWWPDSSKMPANQLKLQYAGQVQGEQAIALLFSAPLNLETLKRHAQVKASTGQAVKGGWELGKNPRLAVFRGVGSGRYTVILAPEIADAQGFMLGQTLKGPVYIQAPQPQ